MVAAYIVGLFALQPRLGFVVDALKERWGDAALATVLTLIAALGGVALVASVSRVWSAATMPERAGLGIAVLLYVLGVWVLEIAQERLHYLEYGLLAALVYTGLTRGGLRRPPAAVIAIVATALLGWLDEELQGRLWERRYFDWRDVRLNLQAAILGTGVAVPFCNVLERRRRDDA